MRICELKVCNSRLLAPLDLSILRISQEFSSWVSCNIINSCYYKVQGYVKINHIISDYVLLKFYNEV